MIEVMVGAMLLTVGILGLIGAFDSSRKLTLLSERRTAMAHRAQLETERLQSYSYGKLAMAAAPTHSSEKTNPDFYVTEGTVSTYQYGEKAAEAESLVVAVGEGIMATSPTGRSCSVYVGACEWADGQVGGKVYDFVTWHTDGNCGAGCPTAENYKRITVVVTASVPGNREPAVVRVSTLIAKPPSS